MSEDAHVIPVCMPVSGKSPAQVAFETEQDVAFMREVDENKAKQDIDIMLDSIDPAIKEILMLCMGVQEPEPIKVSPLLSTPANEAEPKEDEAEREFQLAMNRQQAMQSNFTAQYGPAVFTDLLKAYGSGYNDGHKAGVRFGLLIKDELRTSEPGCCGKHK